VSFDDGDHWQPLQLNLPVTSIRDIDVHGDDVVIATHGRAFWILDDVTPLRQAGPEVASAEAWLFAPATAIRLRPATTGTPLPKDDHRRQPSAGAFIDYVLHARATARWRCGRGGGARAPLPSEGAAGPRPTRSAWRRSG
jgi:hypothetical protein